jgi:hypothetical protein
MLRWMLRPDARLVVAGLGVAAALLIPIAGTLALDSMGSRGETEPGWLFVRSDGRPIRIADHAQADLGVRLERGPDRLLAAYVVGEPGVGVDEALPMPLASQGAMPGLRMLPRSSQHRDLVPGEATLVHPTRLADASTADVLYTASASVRDRLEAEGLEALPPSGARAYLDESVRQIRSSTIALTLASVPIVALIALRFAELDAAEMSRTTSVLAALGHPSRARLFLVARIVAVLLAAALAAAVAASALYLLSPSFRPSPPPWALLAFAAGAPLATALVFGVVRSAWSLRKAGTLLRAQAQPVQPSRMMRRVSPLAQPMLLGTRLLPTIALAGLLFMVDVGFPLAVAGVPQALTGGPGELVRTDSAASILGSRTDARAAEVARHEPSVDGASAEVLVPTLLRGQPVLLRGAAWPALSEYHGLRLVEGEPPTGGQLALGRNLAARLQMGVGDDVIIPGSARMLVRPMVVSGIFAGPNLLEDEAVATLGDGQDLAGLLRTQATVVRARPDSAEALAAMSRTGSDIRVVGLSMLPDRPSVGSLATAQVEVANLGPASGSRLLFVRVHDDAVAQLEASVPGYTTLTFHASFVVPSGDFSLTVNPTLAVPTRDSPVRLEAAPLQFDDRPVTVRALVQGETAQGVPVALYANAQDAAAGAARLAENRTDGLGVAAFHVPAGSYVAASEHGAAVLVRVASQADADVGRIVVERLWLQPAEPGPGQAATVYARVLNVGGAQAEGIVPILLDGAEVSLAAVRLAPGQVTTVEARIAPSAGTHTLAAPGQELSFRTAAPAGTALSGVGVARRSETLARSAADEALGDARAVLLGLGGTALASSLALVHLAVARTVHHRRGVFPIFWSLGLEPDRLRRRATLEAAAMGLAAALVAGAVAHLLFAVARSLQWPLAFGHTVPQPISLPFVLQAAVAFSVACAVATYIALGYLEERKLHSPAAEADPPLPRRSVADILEGGT